jgi:SdrD B-like domain
MNSKHLSIGIAAGVALVAIALGGSSPAVRADGGGSISGTVYFDTNMSSQRDPGEPPAPGQTVNLMTGQDESRVVESVKTRSDGRYSFDDLTPGVNYEVTPAPGGNNFCWDGGGWSVEGDETITDADLWVVEKGPGAVSGTLFDDADEDGVLDHGESAFAGWSIDLRTGAFCSASVVTDSRGGYEFDGMPLAVYDLNPQWPAPVAGQAGYWEQTAPLQFWGDYPPIADLHVPARLDLNEKTDLRNVDVGLHFVTGSGSISGMLFSDSDGDRVKDDGEPPANCFMMYFFRLARRLPSGVPVYLEGVYPNCRDGRFEIADLPAGTYNAGLTSGCEIPTLAMQNQSVTLKEGQRLDGVILPTCPMEPDPFATPQTPAATVVPMSTAVPESPAQSVGPPGTGGGPTSGRSGRIPGTLAAAIGVLGLAALAFIARQRIDATTRR